MVGLPRLSFHIISLVYQSQHRKGPLANSLEQELTRQLFTFDPSAVARQIILYLSNRTETKLQDESEEGSKLQQQIEGEIGLALRTRTPQVRCMQEVTRCQVDNPKMILFRTNPRKKRIRKQPAHRHHRLQDKAHSCLPPSPFTEHSSSLGFSLSSTALCSHSHPTPLTNHPPHIPLCCLAC
jgi:hypothetical protein